MMDLDNFSEFKKLDSQNMLGEIDGLPDQLKSAWKLGQKMPLPESKNIQRIVIAGMGGSAIGADLVAAAVSQSCPVPIVVHRDYDLPAFAKATILEIHQTILALSSMPNRGRAGRVEGTRELVLPRLPYIVVYRVKNVDIEILHIYHGAQNRP